VSTTTIRGGRDAVSVQVDEQGVRIALGPDGISASITLDFGEARLLAEAILDGLQDLLEVVLEVAEERGVVVPVASSLTSRVPDAMWWVVHDEASDEVRFEKLDRRERDLVLMANPPMWPMRDRLFVKRIEDGDLETGFLRPERGPSIWDGADLIEAFESFEQLVDAGWLVD
jgi:hypothetical protein